MPDKSGTLFIARPPFLSPSQYLYWSKWFSAVSQAIVIGTLAAKFLPPAVGLPQELDDLTFSFFLFTGLIFALVGGILNRRGESL